jgi:hypothetical protein
MDRGNTIRPAQTASGIFTAGDTGLMEKGVAIHVVVLEAGSRKGKPAGLARLARLSQASSHLLALVKASGKIRQMCANDLHALQS